MRLSPPLSTPLRISAAALWLPDRRDTTEAALAAGRVDEETATRLGYREVTVSPDHAPPEMAVLAAADALAAAGWSGADVDLVTHAWTYHQGHDFWSPANYVAHHIGASTATAIGIQQMCNGGAAALEVAAARMIADPGVARAAVTTADRFLPPAFDRWLGDYELVYGDAGTALLLDREHGPYELLSVATVARSEYETMHRGDDEFSSMPRTLPRVDVRRTKRAFVASGAEPRFAATLVEAVLEAVHTALTEAGLAPDDPRVRFLALPRLGAGPLEEFFHPAVERLGLRHAEILNLGGGTGHLGAGDSAANLAVLDADKRLAEGEVALLLSLGGGFSWSCVAVRAVAR
ncbi:3-oxoacyl-[acyl-carrier-protein] synthase III C-terminal domain-containing protein [Streptomyces sp. NPDC059070]|uniref:3-oxoacyl-[acyl-carrier-protein] synthase III C-terminal domain-containing protein n=1 Tax=unclassified Streptomyces TaxID=2593676 RepID=UPI0034E1AAEE